MVQKVGASSYFFCCEPWTKQNSQWSIYVFLPHTIVPHLPGQGLFFKPTPTRSLARSLTQSLTHWLTHSLTHSLTPAYSLPPSSFLLPPSSFLLPSPLPVYIFASSSPIWARLDPNLIASSRCSWARLDPNTRQIECQTECQNRCQIDCPIECQTRCQIECQNDVVVLICFNKLLSFPHFKNG